MNFLIRRNLRGCVIEYDGLTFIYESKLFSMSGTLTDDSGDILAVMKRVGWWSFKFEIQTESGSYRFFRKWGNTHLVSKNLDIEYQTDSTLEFYIKGSRRATKFECKKHFLNLWELEILVKDHWHALLIASCFIHKLDIQNHGT